jgi:hypothetical protein
MTTQDFEYVVSGVLTLSPSPDELDTAFDRSRLRDDDRIVGCLNSSTLSIFENFSIIT